MPLTEKAKKMLSSMRKSYGTSAKAEKVFYAMINKIKMKGVETNTTDRSINGKKK